jgi:hypothetical protein
MATVIRVVDKVLTPEEAGERRKRLIAIAEEIELELMERGERKTNEQAHTDRA